MMNCRKKLLLRNNLWSNPQKNSLQNRLLNPLPKISVHLMKNRQMKKT